MQALHLLMAASATAKSIPNYVNSRSATGSVAWDPGVFCVLYSMHCLSKSCACYNVCSTEPGHAPVLQEAVKNCEYWRLIDHEGRPPGLMGWWPSKATTFIDNHDTGASHAPRPEEH